MKANVIHSLEILLIILLIPFSSMSMEVLFPASQISSEQIELCSDKIAEFKLLARDAKYCMKNIDCAVIEGGCPLSCRYYMNKVFLGALETRIDDVKEECSYSVCSATCPERNIKAECRNGVCTYAK